MIWGRASAQRPKRILVGADGANYRLLDFAGGVVGRSLVCQAFNKAPHLPVDWTSSVSSLNTDDVDVASDALDVFPEFTHRGSGLFEESFGGLGRLCGILDFGFWPASGDPNGCGRAAGK